MDFEALMDEAYREALLSPDASTRIGALLVDGDGLVVARGHNAPSPGILPSDPRLLMRPDKYLICEHAERNAVYDAAGKGVPTRGLCMITPWTPCSDCARAVVASGVSRLIYHAEAPLLPGWHESQQVGLELLEIGGIQLDYVSYVPNVEGILAGGTWHHPRTVTMVC